MNGVKRVFSTISVILCITIIWIPFHFALKTLMYGDKRANKTNTTTDTSQ